METNLKKKKSNLQKIILGSFLGILIGSVFGVTVAMFSYNSSSVNSKLIAGDIYMKYKETSAINLNGAMPSSTYPSTSSGNYFEFQITGKNTSTKDITYNVKLAYGDEETGKDRLHDNHLLFKLVEVLNNEEVTPALVEDQSFATIPGATLYTATVAKNTNVETTRTFRVYVRIDENVKIGNTNQDYTLAEWNNSYASVKINVDGGFVTPTVPAGEVVRANIKSNNTSSTCQNATLTYTEDGITYISGSATCVDFNYLWYSGKMWRITAIYPDGAMKLVTDNNITAIAFGETSTGGVNFYTDANTKSYMYQWLNEDFYDTLYNASNIIDTTKQWNATMPENTDISTKPSNTNLVTANVGLLNSYEYYNSYRCNGSSACTSSTYNSYYSGYLNIDYYWWLLNPYNTSYVWHVYTDGISSFVSPTKSYGGRPSIIIKSELSLTGEGTSNSPYKIVGDKSVGVENEYINSRLSGEYVKLSNGSNNQTFRIVGIEDNKTKIVAMDYADSGASRKFATGSDNTLWGSGTTTDADTWYTYLNSTYFPTLVSTYDSANAPFVSGTYEGLFANGTYYFGTSGKNYKLSICANTTSGNTKDCTKTTQVLPNSTNTNPVYIGLLRYGEMFATQQSWGSQTSKNIWLINRYSTSSGVRAVDSNGNSFSNGPTYAYGGRPSIHLSSNVKILSGTGLPNDPYVVGI